MNEDLKSITIYAELFIPERRDDTIGWSEFCAAIGREWDWMSIIDMHNRSNANFVIVVILGWLGCIANIRVVNGKICNNVI